MTSILDLPDRLAGLRGEAAARASRLLEARRITGSTDPPPELEAWIRDTFGSLEAVRDQAIVRTRNLATGESTLIAPLRARRPMDGPTSARNLAAEIDETRGDPFCHPLTGTPAEAWGRVRGRRMVSGANAAIAAAHHAVLVFDEHDPLAFDADLVDDLFATGRRWADRARASDPAATHYTLLWNCLWRAGGSIVHGHAQALLGHGPAAARLEAFRAAAAAYRAAHARSLPDELAALHADLGLAIRAGATATVASLTPVKERELWVIGPDGQDERDPEFVGAVGRAVIGFRDRLGVRSFNLLLWRSPLAAEPGWQGIRPIVRLVDRGDPFSRPSDVGAMELYGEPIVGADPYEVIAALR